MTKQSQRRRHRIDAILQSAVAAFGKNGYHGTSMEQIADRLLMTKGSLYYYFRDKEEILFAVHVEALDRILLEQARVARLPVCPCEKLDRLLREHIRIMVEEFHGTALALEFGALSRRRLGRVVAKRDRYERSLRRLIALGAKRGCLRPVDPKMTGLAILGAINWIARWYRPDGPAKADDVAGRFLDVFMGGLLPQAAVRGRARHRGVGGPADLRAARRRVAAGRKKP